MDENHLTSNSPREKGPGAVLTRMRAKDLLWVRAHHCKLNQSYHSGKTFNQDREGQQDRFMRSSEKMNKFVTFPESKQNKKTKIIFLYVLKSFL